MNKFYCSVLFIIATTTFNNYTSKQWFAGIACRFSSAIKQVHAPSFTNIKTTIATPLVKSFSHISCFISHHKIGTYCTLAGMACTIIACCAQKIRSNSQHKNAMIRQRYTELCEEYMSKPELLSDIYFKNITEEGLRQCAQSLKVPASGYIINIKEAIKQLESDIVLLNARPIVSFLNRDNKHLRLELYKMKDMLEMLVNHQPYFMAYQTYRLMEYHREYAGQQQLPTTVPNAHIDYGEQLATDYAILQPHVERVEKYPALHGQSQELCNQMEAFRNTLVSRPGYPHQEEICKPRKESTVNYQIFELLIDLKNVASRNGDKQALQKLKLIENMHPCSLPTCLRNDQQSPLCKIIEKFNEFKTLFPKYNYNAQSEAEVHANQVRATAVNEAKQVIGRMLIDDYEHGFYRIMPALDQYIQETRNTLQQQSVKLRKIPMNRHRQRTFTL